MNIQMVTASNTLNQLQKKVDTISNNIANMNTAGYKRREATFQELLTQQVNHQPHPEKEMGRLTPNGLRIGYGSMLGQTAVYLGQGSPQQTGRPLDVMIQGEKGWFRIQRTSMGQNNQPVTEELYTRSGAFQWQPDPLDDERVRLVTAQGDLVLDAGGAPISAGANHKSFSIAPDGRLTVEYEDGIEELGSLGLVEISRPDLLLGVGDSLFRASTDAGIAVDQYVMPVDLENNEAYTIQQGFLEMSNVDLSQELTELMMAQRLMQFQARAISIADDMLGLANSIRG